MVFPGVTNTSSKNSRYYDISSSNESSVQPHIESACNQNDHPTIDSDARHLVFEGSHKEGGHIAFSTIDDIMESEPPSPTTGPTPNLGEAAPGIYRSSFPRMGNFDDLRSLHLTTVLTLVAGEYPAENKRFMDENGIQHFQIPIPAHKDPSITIPLESIAKALSIISDRRNHPILIHCNKGKHRTGCIVACYRKMCDWTTPSIIAEYRKYAGNKARPLDEKFIDGFDETSIIDGVASVPTMPGLPTPPASLKDDLKDEDSTPTRVRREDSKTININSA